MLRYYAVATVIVVTFGTVLFLRAHPLNTKWNVTSVRATGTPTLGRKNASSGYRGGNFHGADAPWALSALPECLRQVRAAKSSNANLLIARIPKNARRFAAGTSLDYRDCHVVVRRDDILVSRGADSFRIPPHAYLFQNGDQLLLLRVAGGDAQLRTYIPASQ